MIRNPPKCRGIFCGLKGFRDEKSMSVDHLELFLYEYSPTEKNCKRCCTWLYNIV